MSGKNTVAKLGGREDGRRLFLDKLRSSGLTEGDARAAGVELVRTADRKRPGIHVYSEWSAYFAYKDIDGEPLLTEDGEAGFQYFQMRRLGSLTGFAEQMAEDEVRRYQGPSGVRPFAYLTHGLLKLDWRAISQDPSIPIYIVEGQLKGMAMCKAGFATIALNGVDNFRSRERGIPFLPELTEIVWDGRRVYIVYDSDAATNPNVRRAKRALAFQLNGTEERHASVFDVLLPPGPNGAKVGADDFLVAHGADAFRKLVENAREMKARVQIVLGPEPEEEVDQAIEALTSAENIYQWSGRLTQVTVQPREPRQDAKLRRPEGSPRISVIERARLQGLLSTVTMCLRQNAQSDDPTAPRFRQEAPPAALADGVLQRGQWDGLPVLTGIVEAPVMLPDGSVLTAPGYDDKSGLYYFPSGIGEVVLPEKPSRMDAQRAVKELLDIVVDFPFATEFDRSAWLAAVLTPFCRHALDPSARVPMFIANGNSPGVGKTNLLAMLVGTLYRGRPMSTMDAPPNDEEMGKRLTTFALAGDPLVCIDNVGIEFGWASLDAAVTSGQHSARLLGRNDAGARVDVPMVATFYATGNNITFVGDVIRRVLEIRLETTVDRPETRTGFKHDDLEAHVRANRGRLVAAALTILRAYWAAGRPEQEMPRWGSFEKWSALVRGAVIWAGQPDPAGARETFTETADKGRNQLEAIVEGFKALQEYERRRVAHATENLTGDELKKVTPARDGWKASELPGAVDTAIGWLSSRRMEAADEAGRKALEPLKDALVGMKATIGEIAGEELKFNSVKLGRWLTAKETKPVGGSCIRSFPDRTRTLVYHAEPVAKRGKGR